MGRKKYKKINKEERKKHNSAHKESFHIYGKQKAGVKLLPLDFIG